MKPQFWRGKKVLLTGHTGFKGSWLSLWLQKLGANLVGFSKYIPTKPSLFELADIEKGMTSITGDVCDYKLFEKTISDYQPEIIIHMAAQSLVHQSYKDPIETYSTNVIGTANLLEAIRRRAKPCVVVNVTSDKCYENRELSRGYREDDPLGGYDPYSSSKGCAELVTASYRNSFFNPKEFQKHGIALSSVRAGNVIGGGDWSADRLIPDIVRGIANHKKIKIRSPESIRPWQHVLEPLNGYLLLVEKTWEGGTEYIGAWNFGPNEDDARPVSWILEKWKQMWNNSVTWEIINQQYHETNYLRLDCTKAKTKLGWTPKTNLELALKWTVEWYKRYMEKDNIRKLTEGQIENYSSLLIS